MADQVLGTGTKLMRGTTAGASGTEVARVTSISIGPERDSLETTAHDSDSDEFRTFARGMITAGEINIEGWYCGQGETEHAALLTDLFATSDTALVEWAVVFPDDAATKVYGNAFVTGMPINAPVSELMTFSCTLQWAGKVTVTSS